MQDLTPRIHLTDSDLASLDACGGLGGRLCGEDGRIGPAEFEATMRKQVGLLAVSNLMTTAHGSSVWYQSVLSVDMRVMAMISP